MEIWNSSSIRRTPAEWAFRWLWNQPEVSLVLSGMNAMEQVEENCRIADEAAPGSLTDAELALVERVRARYQEKFKIPCTACEYCMPCPRGVSIPKIFSLYNALYLYNEPFWSKMMYSMNMAPENHAIHCAECGQCEESCPQKISIISELKKCHEELLMEVPHLAKKKD